jgi:hypothetical protein
LGEAIFLNERIPALYSLSNLANNPEGVAKSYQQSPSVDDGKNRMKSPTERRSIAVVRWTARTIGIVLLGLIAAFAIGEGVPNPLTLSIREIMLTVALLTMMFGQVVAWRWEGIGSLLILGGFALFAIVNHGVPLNVVFGPWLVTGLLYLICWVGECRAVGMR